MRWSEIVSILVKSGVRGTFCKREGPSMMGFSRNFVQCGDRDVFIHTLCWLSWGMYVRARVRTWDSKQCLKLSCLPHLKVLPGLGMCGCYACECCIRMYIQSVAPRVFPSRCRMTDVLYYFSRVLPVMTHKWGTPQIEALHRCMSLFIYLRSPSSC